MPIDVKYAAGFFDGEGCILLSFEKSAGLYQPRISISQKFPEILRRFRQRWGGLVCPNRVTDCYAWEVGKKSEIRQFLKDVLPHLEEKHEQAVIMLGFLFRWPRGMAARGPEAEAMFQKLKALKRRPACQKLL